MNAFYYITQVWIDNLAKVIALNSYLLDYGQNSLPFLLKFDPRNAEAVVAQQAYNFQESELNVITDDGWGNGVKQRPDGLYFGNQGLTYAASLSRCYW